MLAKYNYLNILQWARDLRFPCDEHATHYAIKNNNYEMLLWALNNNYKLPNLSNTRYDIDNFSLNMIQLLYLHEYPFNENLLNNAIKNNNDEIINWATEHNCPYDDSTILYAAQYGYLKLLKKLLAENNFRS